MPHSNTSGPLNKRQKVDVAGKAKPSSNASRIFAPFRVSLLILLYKSRWYIWFSMVINIASATDCRISFSH